MATSPDANHYSHVPNHADIAAEQLLLPQWRCSPRIVALVRALCCGVQLVEDEIWDVMIGATSPFYSSGVTLDRWGELLGIYRGGLDPETFRLFVELQIEVNTEAPTAETLLSVLSRAVAPSTVTEHELPPGALMYVIHSGASLLPEARAFQAGQLVRQMRPAGVGITVIETWDGAFKLPWEDPGGTGTIMGSPNPVPRHIYSGRG